MCICCVIVRGSPRFPFILLSVRDEMLARPTSGVRVHPDSRTVCCLDESLPAHKRGTWLAVQPRRGTFSILTNSTQPGRPEPERDAVPSRGLLVLAAAETPSGRVSEPVTAHPKSWTTTTTSDDDSSELPPNPFSVPEAVNGLAGFNLLSGTLLPERGIDLRYTTNLYERCFDKPLYQDLPCAGAAPEGSAPRAWALSNTFLDNDDEPRLAYLRQRATAALASFDSSKGSAPELADLLGEVLLLRPNFTDADLPLEKLNLSDEQRANPVDVELERVCQRNIASYGQWWDPPLMSPAQPLPPAAGNNNNNNNGAGEQQCGEDKAQEEDDEGDRKKNKAKSDEAGGMAPKQESGMGSAHTSAFERQTSRVDLDRFKVSPALTPQNRDDEEQSSTSKARLLEWGTRMHTIVIVERNEQQSQHSTIHYFDRKIDIEVDHVSPKTGVSQQPPHSFRPQPWTHLPFPTR